MTPMREVRFHDREDAAHQLAMKLSGRKLIEPLVLAIPRGGVVTGAILARELGAELDVVLSRKLRAPMHPELAIGAVSENGHVTFNPRVRERFHLPDEYIESETRDQLAEIAWLKRLIRQTRPQALIAGRSVIVTDDGIATGATMIAALQIARTQQPRELIVAVPVACSDSLANVCHWCDAAVCLRCPDDFGAIGEFYVDFSQVASDEVIRLLQEAAATSQTT
jgi:putative phosphoribosyl transferase